MGRDLLARLGIDPDMGIDDSIVPMKEQKSLGARHPGFDQMRPRSVKKAAAHELLGESLWQLLRQVGDGGVEQVVFQYIVEKVGYTPGWNDYQEHTHEYDDIKKGQRIYVLDEGEPVNSCMMSQQEAMDSLQSYAGHSNSRVRLGHAGEVHHLSLVRNGANLKSVLLRMWLLHLDILAGAEVRIHVDSALVRRLMPNHLALEDECEFAKTIPGVRVHVNSMDDTARALLVYATGLHAGEGVSARASRYVWEPVDLTFYGGMLPMSRDVDLLDPAATARAIMAFAEKYDMVPECGEALRMALHMYGTRNPANKLSVRHGVTRLHQQTHQAKTIKANYRCHELASVELVSLAMLVAEGTDLGFGYTLHAAVRRMGLHDTPGMFPFIEPRERLKRDAALALGVEGWLSNMFVSDSYVRRNGRFLYGMTGVMHALALGIVVKGSLLEDVATTMSIPSRGAARSTDDVLTSSEAAADAASWLLLSKLLSDAASAINCSKPALAKVANPEEVLDDACPGYAGASVRFAVVCFSGQMVLRKMVKSNFSFQPTAPEVPVDNVVVSDEQVLQNRLSEKAANADARDWVSDLLRARGPKASTTTRRRNQVVEAANLAPDEPAVVIGAVPVDLHDQVETLVNRGWAEQETSGERLECGANALHQSLEAHGAVTGADVPTRDEVLTALRTSLSPEQRQRAEDAGIALEANDFTADQLAAAVQRFGPYSLGIIDGPPEDARAYRVGDGECIFVRNYAGHWSGVGPGSRRIGLQD